MFKYYFFFFISFLFNSLKWISYSSVTVRTDCSTCSTGHMNQLWPEGDERLLTVMCLQYIFTLMLGKKKIYCIRLKAHSHDYIELVQGITGWQVVGNNTQGAVRDIHGDIFLLNPAACKYRRCFPLDITARRNVGILSYKNNFKT